MTSPTTTGSSARDHWTPHPVADRAGSRVISVSRPGELGHGTQLPTELELGEHYGASRNTIRDAVKLLVTRGLVETRPGQGTFVVEKIDPFVTTLDPRTGFGGREGSAAYASEVAARNRKAETSAPRVEIQQATGMIASELKLAEGSTVVSRHQQRFIDGTLWSLQTTFYPMRLAEQGAVLLIQAADIEQGGVQHIEEKLGIKQVGLRDKITVRAPDQNETKSFRLPDDGRVAVFETLETGFDESGRPIRLTVTTYPADRNQFVVNLGKVPAEMASAPAINVTDHASATASPSGGSG